MTELVASLRAALEAKSLHDVRQIGRAIGVKDPTSTRKEALIENILAIAKNEADPCPRSSRGKPPKSEEYDRELLEELENCRKLFSQSAKEETGGNILVFASDGDEDEVYSGVLEFTEKFWFVRTNNMQLSSTGDVFMHASFVNRFHLRTGDKIVCKAKRRKPNECPGVTYVISVNGRSPELNRTTFFERLTPCYPDTKIKLEHEGGTLTDRVVDLFSPIGFGQRALIVSPPKAGKTTMLKNLASSICGNYPQVLVIVLLIDERPEEVTDIRRSVEGAEVIYSTFDKGEAHHTHTAALTLEYAKRQVETGRDVVILLDSITRLTRAHNAMSNSGRTLSGGLDPQALVEPKRFFGAARNIEGGGSLTIIATALIDTGSRLDDVIYEEFKSTGNMEIVLSRAMAERRLFPAIDIGASGARKEELLLTEEELEAVSMLRGMLAKKLTVDDLLAAIKKTETNAQFCSKAQAFFKAYGSK